MIIQYTLWLFERNKSSYHLKQYKPLRLFVWHDCIDEEDKGIGENEIREKGTLRGTLRHSNHKKILPVRKLSVNKLNKFH